MTEKFIHKTFKKVEGLLARQLPYEALEVLDELLSSLSKDQDWYKAKALFWKQLANKQILKLKEAVISGTKSYRLFKKLGDKAQASNVLRDLASVYEDWGKFGKALEIINKSLVEIGDQQILFSLGMALARKGKILSKIGDKKGAEVALLSSEQIIDSSDHLMHRLTVSTYLMELYVHLKEFRKAEFYANKSELILRKLHNKEGYLNEVRYSQIEASRGIIAQSQGKFKEVLIHFGNFLKYGIRPKRIK